MISIIDLGYLEPRDMLVMDESPYLMSLRISPPMRVGWELCVGSIANSSSVHVLSLCLIFLCLFHD